MKKWIIAAGLVAAAVMVMLVWAPWTTVAAQDVLLRRADPQLRVFRTGGSSIGVTIRDVTSDDVAKAKLDGARGVFIESVRDGSPASRAGFRTGDIMLEYDGERVRSVQQFTRLVEETPAGRMVRAVVNRDGGRQTLDVTPESGTSLPELSTRRPDRGADILRNFNFNVDNLAPEIRTLVSPRQLGVTLETLSEQLETYFGVTNGVLVSNVQADSPASAAGLRAGDVITQVNGRRVEAPNDVSQAVRTANAGAAIDLTVMREKKELKLKATLPERRRVSGGRGVAL